MRTAWIFALLFLFVGLFAIAHAETVGPNTPVITEHGVLAMEDTFQFVPGDRRDPFTFAKSIPQVNVPQPGGDVGERVDQPLRMTAEQIAAKRAEMLQYYQQAEQAVMDCRYIEAFACTERALDCVRDIHISDYRPLQEARDQILRVRKVADRAKRREECERDFQILNLHLTGVVISQKLPRAIINGKVVGAGDRIPVGDAIATVYSIDAQRVTLMYYGYRMPVELESK